MEILDLALSSANTLVRDYIENQLHSESFFDYDIHSSQFFEERAEDLSRITFQRDRLVKTLEAFNAKYTSAAKTFENIQLLNDKRSVVVIGGQQAGLLTGPLYSIHKIISILKLAEEQKEKLGIPVIPVFWIAGEDHDFAEVNHVYVSEESACRKSVYPKLQREKSMVSAITIDKKICKSWVNEIFIGYGETAYTNSLMKRLHHHIEVSETMVDFFARLIHELFSDTGLVLIDSAYPELRKMETDYFKNIIHKNVEIHDTVLLQQALKRDHNYSNTIEMKPYSANLFYEYKGERILLEYDIKEATFKGSLNQFSLSIQELENIATNQPDKLSNNVVTRPLMQEFLFPTLAFISGPGEIAYWSELKQVFLLFGLKMPPIIPRLMITLLERPIEMYLKDKNIEIVDVLTNGVNEYREQWVDTHRNKKMDELIEAVKEEVESIHDNIRKAAIEMDSGLTDVLHKNAGKVQEQFDFLQKAIMKSWLKRNEIELSKFKKIELSLRPNGSPQERIWNIYYYINKYGDDFIKQLLVLPMEFNGKHKLIKI